MTDENTLRKRLVQTDGTDQDSSKNGEEKVGFHFANLKSFKHTIKECLEWVRILVLCFAAGAIMIGVVYNFFANTEKDIPDAVFQKLYKFMEVQAAAHVTSSSTESNIPEWIQLPLTNETNN